MAEDSAQLPVLMNQEYRVKLGRSFLFPKDNAFHTIKCEFIGRAGAINASVSCFAFFFTYVFPKCR